MGMSQKFPVNGFKRVNDLSRFNENSDIGYFLEVDVEYPKKLFSLHKDLLFLPERRKLEKVDKVVCYIEDKEKIHHSHKSLKGTKATCVKIATEMKKCSFWNLQN